MTNELTEFSYVLFSFSFQIGPLLVDSSMPIYKNQLD